MFRNDTYTGGNHFWIRFHNGQHEVRMETPDYCDDNETVFVGHYEDCVKYINNLLVTNADYDLNL